MRICFISFHIPNPHLEWAGLCVVEIVKEGFVLPYAMYSTALEHLKGIVHTYMHTYRHTFMSHRKSWQYSCRATCNKRKHDANKNKSRAKQIRNLLKKQSHPGLRPSTGTRVDPGRRAGGALTRLEGGCMVWQLPLNSSLRRWEGHQASCWLLQVCRAGHNTFQGARLARCSAGLKSHD